MCVTSTYTLKTTLLVITVHI